MALIKQYDRNTEAKRKKENIIYSDFFKNFNAHPEKKDLARHVNEYAVTEALKNLILTNKGERFFNNLYGCDISKALFENINPFTMSTINTLIQTAIRNFEPRVNVIDLTTAALPDNNSVEITITYSLINDTTPITFSLILDRVR